MGTPDKLQIQRWTEHVVAARQAVPAMQPTVFDALMARLKMSDEELGQVLPQAGIEVGTVMSHAPEWAQLDRVTSKALRCVVTKALSSGQRSLAMADPWDEALLQRISRRVATTLEPLAVSAATLEVWLSQEDAPKGVVATPAEAGASAVVSSRPLQGAESKAVDSPIVVFADRAIRCGYEQGASDIHFECDRAGVTVKHRLDGVMVRFDRLEGQQAAQEVISRIKVLAQLDITERRIPQDGRFRFGIAAHAEGAIDLRVSIMPSVFGEDAVLRLLDKAQLRQQDSPVSLDLLGFDVDGAQLLRDLSNEPSGMVLVTGPTGSGKTTTVYAALSEINTGLEKIITIEDPVEYELLGVLQIPVNERKGLTFAKGLRSILRHDPDRILVGEIRDAETAEIAVQSALTGHLVFTTVHANGIADIMGRFRHFGLDMFGFMSSLNGVVVQRLMRRVCPHCVQEREITEREMAWFARSGISHPSAVPRTVGCDACKGTGYKGRFVVAEVHVIDDAMRDHVTEGSPVSVLKRHAQEQGVVSLTTQAGRKVLAFETTIEEVKRVVGWI